MKKTLSVKNAKDLKTTIIGVIGGIVIVAGLMWPDKIDVNTQAVISEAAGQIITGIGTLIALIPAIFGKD